jgi:hypothetical protein
VSEGDTDSLEVSTTLRERERFIGKFATINDSRITYNNESYMMDIDIS